MSDAGELTSKLSGEFSAAKERVRAMQQAAEDRHRRLLEGYQQFLRSAQQVKDLLKPRGEAFESFFKGARKSISRLDLGPGGNEYRGTFVTYDFPHTEECPAHITLRFSLTHDEPIEQLILGYNLEMVPIFLQFKAHDDLALPVDKVDGAAVIDWFDRCVLEFTRTYLDMQFNPQYQKETLARDVVLDVAFPRMFAAGRKEYGGSTLYFLTEDSLHTFEQDPGRYVNKPASAEKAGGPS
jgi:YHS domain-containing protein